MSRFGNIIIVGNYFKKTILRIYGGLKLE